MEEHRDMFFFGCPKIRFQEIRKSRNSVIFFLYVALHMTSKNDVLGQPKKNMSIDSITRREHIVDNFASCYKSVKTNFLHIQKMMQWKFVTEVSIFCPVDGSDIFQACGGPRNISPICF